MKTASQFTVEQNYSDFSPLPPSLTATLPNVGPGLFSGTFWCWALHWYTGIHKGWVTPWGLLITFVQNREKSYSFCSYCDNLFQSPYLGFLSPSYFVLTSLALCFHRFLLQSHSALSQDSTRRCPGTEHLQASACSTSDLLLRVFSLAFHSTGDLLWSSPDCW